MSVLNPTIARISTRALIGRRRSLLLIPLPALVIGLAVLADSLGAEPTEWSRPVINALGLGVMLPVVSLIVGTGVLGAEIDDGTIVHVLAKPVPRREIVLSKYAVAVAITVATIAVPLAVTGAMADGGRYALGLIVGAAVGAVAYTALFLLLSLLTRRPVLLGLVYILIWEGLLSRLLRGTRVLSIQQYVLSIAHAVSDSALLKPTVSVPVAAVMSAVISVAAIVLAVDRLRSFSVAGETS
jgi:ABC-2 type transport system permease protein